MHRLIFGSTSSGLVISASTFDVNIATLAGNPAGVVQILCKINSGVVVGGSAGSLFSLRTGTFAAGSTLSLINFGSILGSAGGRTGNGSGGAAIYLDFPITINNGSGNIYGAGGAGATGVSSSGPGFAGGGGGGSGIGHQGNLGLLGLTGGFGASGQDGASGSISGFGIGGAGGVDGTNSGGGGAPGGSWGENGFPSSPNNFGQVSNSFGLAGAAIITNGHAVLWLSGFTSDRVKGIITS